jgi:hypothetical protein
MICDSTPLLYLYLNNALFLPPSVQYIAVCYLYWSGVVIICYCNGHSQGLSLESNILPALAEILMKCRRQIGWQAGSSRQATVLLHTGAAGWKERDRSCLPVQTFEYHHSSLPNWLFLWWYNIVIIVINGEVCIPNYSRVYDSFVILWLKFCAVK